MKTVEKLIAHWERFFGKKEGAECIKYYVVRRIIKGVTDANHINDGIPVCKIRVVAYDAKRELMTGYDVMKVPDGSMIAICADNLKEPYRVFVKKNPLIWKELI